MFEMMMQWLLSTVTLLAVAMLMPGFYVEVFLSTAIAAGVIGLLNATFGVFIKAVTFPFSLFAFGACLLAINALMILLASKLVSGFDVQGDVPALWAAAVMALLGIIFRVVTKPE